MKLPIYATMVLFVAGGLASATPIDGGACSSGTLDQYIALTLGCTYNGVLFSNFGESHGGSASDLLPARNAISVRFTGTTPDQLGISFDATWGTTGPGRFNTYNQFIYFQAQALTVYWFGGVTLSATGSTNTKSKANKVVESLSTGDVFEAPLNETTMPTTTASITFPSPVNTLTLVQKEIQLHEGKGSWAKITNVSQTFDMATPEPATCVLIGGGLIGLALLRRKLGLLSSLVRRARFKPHRFSVFGTLYLNGVSRTPDTF